MFYTNNDNYLLINLICIPMKKYLLLYKYLIMMYKYEY